MTFVYDADCTLDTNLIIEIAAEHYYDTSFPHRALCAAVALSGYMEAAKVRS